MSVIDFTEIDPGNKGGQDQDTFELFSRDFLEAIGFKIIQDPSRGNDRKKDMIVSGIWDNDQKIIWLVSCKHNAKSGKSVNDTDEPNITERLKLHKCQGFIGVYSTISSSGLSDLLHGQEFPYIIFDHKKIESLILQDTKRYQLFFRYFTNSYEKYKDHLTTTIFEPMKLQSSNTNLTEDDFLRISLTAGIIIEIEKIKEKYSSVDWENKIAVISEFHKYSEHTNLKIANTIFPFLEMVANHAGNNMPTEIAVDIYSLTINYFPSTKNLTQDEINDLSNEVMYIAFALVYESLLYSKDYKIAMHGLTLLKYLYRKGQQLNNKEILDIVDGAYEKLEAFISERKRENLKTALELLNVFKTDRLKGSLAFPPLPEDLHRIIYKESAD